MCQQNKAYKLIAHLPITPFGILPEKSYIFIKDIIGMVSALEEEVPFSNTIFPADAKGMVRHARVLSFT